MRQTKGYHKLMKLAQRHPKPSPWWFRPDYSDPDYSRRFFLIYDPASEPAAEALEFFASYVSQGQTLLDIGCGGGAFALAMAQRGLQVTGIDLGPYPIEQAVSRSEERGLDVEWICGSALEQEFDRQFDCITLLGSQLREFPPEELQQLLEKVKQWLKPEGHFISEVGALSPSEREYGSYWYLPEVCLYTDKKALVLGENFYDEAERVRVLREYALEIQTGRLLVGGSTEKEYTEAELAAMNARAGLQLVATYGDWDRSANTAESKHAICVSKLA